MPLQPISSAPLLISPPLALPLKVRVPGGRFASTRKDAGQTMADGTGYDRIRMHPAVDILADPDDAVFCIADGRVIDVYTGTGGDRVVVIEHLIDGRGYLSRYHHLIPDNSLLDASSAVGTTIGVGEPVGRVQQYPGTNPPPNHLHLEVRISSLESSNHAQVADRLNTIPLDPLPDLYKLDIEYHRLNGKEVRNTYSVKSIEIVIEKGLDFARISTEDLTIGRAKLSVAKNCTFL